MILILSRVFERAENVEDEQEIAFARRDFLGLNGELIPEHTMRTIESDAVDFIKDNSNMLTSYYIEGNANNVPVPK